MTGRSRDLHFGGRQRLGRGSTRQVARRAADERRCGESERPDHRRSDQGCAAAKATAPATATRPRTPQRDRQGLRRDQNRRRPRGRLGAGPATFKHHTSNPRADGWEWLLARRLGNSFAGAQQRQRRLRRVRPGHEHAAELGERRDQNRAPGDQHGQRNLQRGDSAGALAGDRRRRRRRRTHRTDAAAVRQHHRSRRRSDRRNRQLAASGPLTRHNARR